MTDRDKAVQLAASLGVLCALTTTISLNEALDRYSAETLPVDVFSDSFLWARDEKESLATIAKRCLP